MPSVYAVYTCITYLGTVHGTRHRVVQVRCGKNYVLYSTVLRTATDSIHVQKQDVVTGEPQQDIKGSRSTAPLRPEALYWTYYYCTAQHHGFPSVGRRTCVVAAKHPSTAIKGGAFCPGLVPEPAARDNAHGTALPLSLCLYSVLATAHHQHCRGRRGPEAGKGKGSAVASPPGWDLIPFCLQFAPLGDSSAVFSSSPPASCSLCFRVSHAIPDPSTEQQLSEWSSSSSSCRRVLVVAIGRRGRWWLVVGN